MIYTTLLKLSEHGRYLESWDRLFASIGKTPIVSEDPDDYGAYDNDPIPLLAILECNGYRDAVWALRAVDGYDGPIRSLACDFAERVVPGYETRHGNNGVRSVISASRRAASGNAASGYPGAVANSIWGLLWTENRVAAKDYAWSAAFAVAASVAWIAAYKAMQAGLRNGDEESIWQERRFREWLNDIK